jgi:hypothetical protein
MISRYLIFAALCLFVNCIVNAEDTGFPPKPECYEGMTTEMINVKREAFRDSGKLKAELIRFLPINGRFDFQEFPWFKNTFDVQEEILRPVLLEIFNEARLKDLDDPKYHLDRLRAMRSITGLGRCADEETKQLLRKLSTDLSTPKVVRMRAVEAYLQSADPEETKNALLRSLVGEERMDSQDRSSICEYARMVFVAADSEKKEAIIHALILALSREDNKWLFRVYDNILCEMSKDYANSRQRLDIVKRLISAPSLCKVDDYVMPELQEKLKILQKTRLNINISTNIEAIKARNFNVPLQADETNELISISLDSMENNVLEAGQGNNWVIRKLAVLGAGGMLIIALGFGLWKLTRK